ncbi:unknown [Clostridium sp. CAG:306]|nr:unknown [Clostridium sp. CAG:306]
MTNKEKLLNNIRQASPERVKKHLIELITDLVEECQIKEGMDNGYIDNDNDIPVLDFYIDNFMFTNFAE